MRQGAGGAAAAGSPCFEGSKSPRDSAMATRASATPAKLRDDAVQRRMQWRRHCDNCNRDNAAQCRMQRPRRCEGLTVRQRQQGPQQRGRCDGDNHNSRDIAMATITSSQQQGCCDDDRTSTDVAMVRGCVDVLQLIQRPHVADPTALAV